MSYTISQVKDHLTGMGGGASIDDVVNLYELLERASIKVNARMDALDCIRDQQLSQFVHDDLKNYALPADYGKLIDLANVEDRQSSDVASRTNAERFSARQNITNKIIAIESRNGTKYIRINWKDTGAKTLHTMDSLTSNGTIAVVGTASGLKATTQYKLSGTASIEVDIAASGDGIQCTGMTAKDLSDEDEIGDFIVPIYLNSVSGLTSISLIFGNDLTTNYWTSVAQTTQSDGTAFKVGWNYLLFPWSTATESGTVAPAAIDAFKLTFATTSALSNVRVDNILCSIGRPFDLKYYSQYAFISAAGTWLTKPTTDDDSVIYSGTAFMIFLMECLLLIWQQLKTDSKDFTFSKTEMNDLYKQYKHEYPSMAKKLVNTYWHTPVYRR